MGTITYFIRHNIFLLSCFFLFLAINYCKKYVILLKPKFVVCIYRIGVCKFYNNLSVLPNFAVLLLKTNLIFTIVNIKLKY